MGWSVPSCSAVGARTVQSKYNPPWLVSALHYHPLRVGADTVRWLLWTSFAPLNISTGAGTTLTIVALIADVGRDHVATATSCTSCLSVNKSCKSHRVMLIDGIVSYLFRTTGQVLGVSLSGALTQAILAKELGARITGPGADEVYHPNQFTADTWRADARCRS